MTRIAAFLVAVLLSLVSAKDFNLGLEYSVDGVSFTKFAEIHLQQKLDGNFTSSWKSDASISNKMQKDLESAVRKEDRARYYVRSGDLLSSNLICYMLKVNLHHEIAITVDQEREAILSLTVFPKGLYDAGSAEEDCSGYTSAAAPSKLKGRVTVTTVGVLPSPETAAYLQRMEEEKRARQHGAAQDNRSFLAKYWMYIVPIVIFMVVSSAMGGEEGGQ